jgi:hypothetical protein
LNDKITEYWKLTKCRGQNLCTLQKSQPTELANPADCTYMSCRNVVTRLNLLEERRIFILSFCHLPPLKLRQCFKISSQQSMLKRKVYNTLHFLWAHYRHSAKTSENIPSNCKYWGTLFPFLSLWLMRVFIIVTSKSMAVDDHTEKRDDLLHFFSLPLCTTQSDQPRLQQYRLHQRPMPRSAQLLFFFQSRSVAHAEGWVQDSPDSDVVVILSFRTLPKLYPVGSDNSYRETTLGTTTIPGHPSNSISRQTLHMDGDTWHL